MHERVDHLNTKDEIPNNNKKKKLSFRTNEAVCFYLSGRM